MGPGAARDHGHDQGAGVAGHEIRAAERHIVEMGRNSDQGGAVYEGSDLGKSEEHATPIIGPHLA